MRTLVREAVNLTQRMNQRLSSNHSLTWPWWRTVRVTNLFPIPPPPMRATGFRFATRLLMSSSSPIQALGGGRGDSPSMLDANMRQLVPWNSGSADFFRAQDLVDIHPATTDNQCHLLSGFACRHPRDILRSGDFFHPVLNLGNSVLNFRVDSRNRTRRILSRFQTAIASRLSFGWKGLNNIPLLPCMSTCLRISAMVL